MANERDSFYHGMSSYQGVVVGDNKHLMNALRSALKSIGFKVVDPFPTFRDSLGKAQLPSTTHVLFALSGKDMSSLEYVQEVMKHNKRVTMIAITEDPFVDNVFDLIKSGARGFLIPPTSMESVEAVLVSATKGPPISETILSAEDRNEAFAKLILDALYRTASIMKQARTNPSMEVFIDKCILGMQQSVALAKMFCEVGEEALLDKIVAECVRRADDRKTRLSAIRQDLKKLRSSDGQQTGA